MTNQTTQDVARLRVLSKFEDEFADVIERGVKGGSVWSGPCPERRENAAVLRRAADAMERLAALQSAGGDVTQDDIDSLLTEAATYDLYDNKNESDIAREFARKEAAKYRRVVNAVAERDRLKARNESLKESAEIWERNSEDACQLWELLRQVDQEAGNSAAPARRHSLTPMLRDSIEKLLREKPKPEDRITAIREERDRLREAVKVLREGLKKSLRHTDVVDNAVIAWGCCGEGQSCERCEKAQSSIDEITEARQAIEKADAILAGKEPK